MTSAIELFETVITDKLGERAVLVVRSPDHDEWDLRARSKFNGTWNPERKEWYFDATTFGQAIRDTLAELFGDVPAPKSYRTKFANISLR